MRRTEENDEQTELAVGQSDLTPVGPRKPARVQVELPAVESIRAHSVGSTLLHFRPPSQHGADACEQLARAEGLRHVVVGAQLQTHHAIRLLAPAGQHDDRNRRFVAQPARKRHSVLVPELQIEHDEVHDVVVQSSLHRRAIGDGRDAKPARTEIVRNRLLDDRIVIDDDNVGQRWSALNLRAHECAVLVTPSVTTFTERSSHL